MTPPSTPAPRSMWAYARGLAPVILVWILLAGWLAGLVYDRGKWSDESDEAVIREWLDESRVFRKTLPELVREYSELRHRSEDHILLREKRAEIIEHLRGMTEPIRAYNNLLPTFPIVYHIEVRMPAQGAERPEEKLAWESPLPRPRQQNQSRVHDLEYFISGTTDSPMIRCDYQLHAFNKLQRQAEERQRASLVAWAVLVAATLLASIFVYRFLRRERLREQKEIETQADAQRREREVLEIRLRQKEAEQAREELDRKLLEQQLDAATLQQRADEAEKAALEMKSELYASIGIMAGSYAHNIKNLLVRPNDLLVRCIEVNGLQHAQTVMLEEVRSTLGTVTDRLQEILRTVRRDPSKSETTPLNLNQMIHDTQATWTELAQEKWKLRIDVEQEAGPLEIRGDLSHLQQAIENLLFNARDATFEMRNHLRESVRTDATLDATARRRRLIEAAAWKGHVILRTHRDRDAVVLEVRDNGMGMTEEVRENCLRTHFTTKRDNALYEGYNAGMGLGLSFVAVVLEHHQASLSIESAPGQGACFRIRFPIPNMAETQPLVEDES